MTLDKLPQVTEFSADQIATLRQALDRMETSAVGVGYGTATPTLMELGKIHVVDDGTTQTVNVKTAKGNIVSLTGNVPSGVIMMWSGSIATIPTGYVLCDGSNSTPDLTNRFVVCADADDSGTAKSTVTGSALQTSDGQIPAHAHDIPNDAAGSGSLCYNQSGDGAFSSTVDTDSTGTGTKNIAVFYALAFIMKT